MTDRTGDGKGGQDDQNRHQLPTGWLRHRTGDGQGRQDAPERHQLPVGWLLPAALAVARRPRLWGVAVRQMLRLAPRGWWWRWPPLPVPDPSYLRFRLQTAYGDPDRPPSAHDVVAYLEWCRDFGRLR